MRTLRGWFQIAAFIVTGWIPASARHDLPPPEHVGGCNAGCMGDDHWLLGDEHDEDGVPLRVVVDGVPLVEDLRASSPRLIVGDADRGRQIDADLRAYRRQTGRLS